MEGNIKFSIIVPIYKTEKYIRECVDSILSQSYPQFEAILVDDGSPDACPAICDEYAQKDARIRVVHKKNGGLVSARKAGAEIATGDFVINLDSDDYIDQNLLLDIAHDIELSGADVICFGLTLFGGKNGSQMRYLFPRGTYILKNSETRAKILEKAIYDRNRGMNYGCFLYSICSKAIKTELYKNLQNNVRNDITTGEDLAFTLSLLDEAESIYISDRSGYYYRVNDSSMTHTYKAGDLKNAFRVVSLILDHAKTDAILEHQAYAYALMRTWDIVSGYAKNANSFRALKSFIRSEISKEQAKFLSRARIRGRNKRENCIVFLVKNHLWLPIYILAKHKSNKKRD